MEGCNFTIPWLLLGKGLGQPVVDKQCVSTLLAELSGNMVTQRNIWKEHVQLAIWKDLTCNVTRSNDTLYINIYKRSHWA